METIKEASTGDLLGHGDHHADLNLGNDVEFEHKLNHPDLPSWITIKKQTYRQRVHPIKDAIERAKTRMSNEKELRCKEFYNTRRDTCPVSFTENSNKEKLVLEHVKKYSEQFSIAYKSDRKLFLHPQNECGVEKFISTTIRPTKLGYLEFYDYIKCSEYMSNFIMYEPLENPLEFPTYLPSPTSVIEWQKGDCFDMSVLLCSLLIGVGYDAYCVVGTAPYEITLKNEGLMENPYLDIGLKDLEYKEKEIIEEPNKTYALDPRESDQSLYDQKVAKERAAKEARDFKLENDILDDDEPDRLPPDEYDGKRIHCWVMIKRDKGTRMDSENVFIEASTGRIWEIAKHNYPYHKIDHIFNHRNFWINLNPEADIRNLKFEYMDNGEKNEWEYVMIDTVKFPTLEANEEEEDDVKKVVPTNPKAINNVAKTSPRKRS